MTSGNELHDKAAGFRLLSLGAQDQLASEDTYEDTLELADVFE